MADNFLKKFLFGIAALIFYSVILFLYNANLVSDYFLRIINISLIYIIYTTSLNLINGYTGLFSLGHLGFAAIGAYISSALTTLVFKLSIPATDNITIYLQNYALFFLCVLIAGLMAALISFIVGAPVLRVKDDYLAIITLAFGEIIRVSINAIDYLGGPRGLPGIPQFSNFTIIFAFAFLTVLVLRNIVFSTFGKACIAIREDELVAQFLGINVIKYKISFFVIGAFFAGIGGALFAHLLQYIHPTQFGFMNTIMILVMLYAGGMGSLSGSILAAFALTIISEFLRIGIHNFANATGLPLGDEWRMVLYSLLLIIIILFKPNGLLGDREFKVIIPDREKQLL